ncbi:beta-hexosaminidase [hydrocarbon metagenome]|uniref:beta-N-acetylhexosaminidase n=1 Tax=hydrocarbon metagenome TaxID=938273 RepID=A0A0W8FV91_9ZZZZ
MRYTISIIVFLVISLLIPSERVNQYSKPKYTFDKLFPLQIEDLLWVDSVFNSLTLREKVAQLVIPYAYGRDTIEDSRQYRRLKHLVEEEKVGGFLFLQGTIKIQTAILNQLQKISKIPLLISADYERGLGMRLNDAVEFPYKMAFAAAGKPINDYKMGKIVGQEALAIGVHHNYSPLVDVVHDYRNPIINVRSYSSDPEIISIHSEAFIKGMHESKVITTAKHFPGHGATDLDSHNELPLIDLNKDELWEVDLKTFKSAVNAGVKSVMIGHLDVPELTDVNGMPATFSYNVVTRLLKNEIGFDGLVVTDALNMQALTKEYSQKQIGVLSIQAGNDILLFPSNEKEMIDGIVEAINIGRLSEERINESVRKILKVKKWLGIDKNRFVNCEQAEREINKKSHFRLAQDIAEASVTLVKDEAKLIPIDPNKYGKVYSITISDSRFKRTIEEPFPFEKALNDNFGYVKNYRVNFSTKKNEYTKILFEIRQADLVILSIYANVRSSSGRIDLHQEQFDFIDDILDKNKPTVAISLGNPFILSEVTRIPTYLTTYGNVALSQIAALDAILGNTKISGKLPVSLPNTELIIGSGISKSTKGLFFPKNRVDTNYNFSKVDSLMMNALKEKIFPGASIIIGHRNRIVYHQNFGKGTYEKDAKPIDDNSIFDIASLTKVAATTSAVMLLFDKGKINLDDKVEKYLPQFGNGSKDKITIKHLLLHNSGLPAWEPFYKKYTNPDEVIDAIMKMELEFSPGTKYLYSDIGMIVLQKVIEKITNKGIDEYLEENLFNQLQMKNTFFNPSPKVWYNCVPTETDDYWRMQLLKGKVHDETAYLLGGVAGHAGLFSTTEDLANLISTYVNDGYFGSKQIFSKKTIDLFTKKNSNQSTRALGWDTKSAEKSSAGNLFSDDSFGHTGFTGTSIWVDRNEGLFVILLTNRVHPTRSNTKIIQFRPLLHDEIYKAVTD